MVLGARWGNDPKKGNNFGKIKKGKISNRNAGIVAALQRGGWSN